MFEKWGRVLRKNSDNLEEFFNSVHDDRKHSYNIEHIKDTKTKKQVRMITTEYPYILDYVKDGWFTLAANTLNSDTDHRKFSSGLTYLIESYIDTVIANNDIPAMMTIIDHNDISQTEYAPVRFAHIARMPKEVKSYWKVQQAVISELDTLLHSDEHNKANKSEAIKMAKYFIKNHFIVPSELFKKIPELQSENVIG